MPVHKLRTLQEAEDALWRDPDDPQLWSHIASLWEFSHRLFPRKFPPGVYKHRSIEEANQQREAWNRQAIQDVNRNVAILKRLLPPQT